MDIAGLGIRENLLLDLVLRRLLLEGSSNLRTIAQKIRVSAPIVDHIFRYMRNQQMIEVKSMTGNDYNFVLSALGRQTATERFQTSQYAGACPVSLRDYHAAVRAQSAKVQVDRGTLRQAFGDLVVPDRLLDQLGPALIAQSSIFVYGPSGNGKTSIAERMLRVYQDAVMIPHAIEVDNQIISVFDPVVHQALATEESDLDPRWVMCRRPCIVVGGELVPSMLELRLDEASGIYTAPLQMKANNGIFIIDDLGRQRLSTDALFNRWIVPMEEQVDHLGLANGLHFTVPFDVVLVFSTNLNPTDVADEAFLRRIGYKIAFRPIPADQYRLIWADVCRKHGLAFDRKLVDFVINDLHEKRGVSLLPCHPRDLIAMALDHRMYSGAEPALSEQDLRWAWNNYFLDVEPKRGAH